MIEFSIFYYVNSVPLQQPFMEVRLYWFYLQQSGRQAAHLLANQAYNKENKKNVIK